MRDSRLDLFTSQPVTLNSATTENGETIDLLDNYVGDYFQGTEFMYGIGVEVIIYDSQGAAGTDALGVTVKIQVADDDGAGSPDTWVDDAIVYDTDDFEQELADSGGTKLALPFRIHTQRQYARIVVVTTIESGSASDVKIRGWASDGSPRHSYAYQRRW